MADDTTNVTITLAKDAKHAVSIRNRADMTGRDGEAVSMQPGETKTVRVEAHQHVALSLGAFVGEGEGDAPLDPGAVKEEGTTGEKDPSTSEE